MMMNAKKSSIGTTWKYLFILPLLMVFMSVLNEPSAFANEALKKGHSAFETISFEGNWFATIKQDKLNIRFEEEGGKGNQNSNTFSLAEFSALPKDKSGNFSLEREAGRMDFNGKFDGSIGMGQYKFTPNESFAKYLRSEEIEEASERDLLVYFMVNLKKVYVAALKKEGFTDLTKDELIPLSALNVDMAYIKSIKNAGFKNLQLKDLIPLKALDISAAYIKEMQQSGTKELSLDRIVALKAQGFTGDILKDALDAEKEHKKAVRNVDRGNNYDKGEKGNKGSKEGYNDDDLDVLGALFAKKVLNVTAEYIKGFKDIGYQFEDGEYLALKSLGITPEFIKEMEAIGWGKPTSENIFAFKALGVSPAQVEAYRKIGYPNISSEDFIAAKTLGVTPEYILNMRKKGKNYSSLQKYIEVKSMTAVLGVEN